MKKDDKKILVAMLGLVALFFALGLAGDCDFTEQTILHMSHDEYDWVKDTLTKKHGKQPSEREIAHFWAEYNKK